mgnify:FL=1
MLGVNGFIYILFFDPYHELNPMVHLYFCGEQPAPNPPLEFIFYLTFAMSVEE